MPLEPLNICKQGTVNPRRQPEQVTVAAAGEPSPEGPQGKTCQEATAAVSQGQDDGGQDQCADVQWR